jgi:hypothetical protein
MADPNPTRTSAAAPASTSTHTSAVEAQTGPILQKPVALPPSAAQHPQVRWSTPGLENLLSGYFAQIEIKIADSKKKAHQDFVEYWAVKSLILAGTLGAGVLEAYGKGSWVPALGFFASAFAVVDAIRPRSAELGKHRRAETELTRLLEQVRSEWEVAKLKANPALAGTDLRNTAVAILEKITVKTELSGRFVGTGDTARPEPVSPSQAA